METEQKPVISALIRAPKTAMWIFEDWARLVCFVGAVSNTGNKASRRPRLNDIHPH